MESDWVYCHFRQKKDSLNNFMTKSKFVYEKYLFVVFNVLLSLKHSSTDGRAPFLVGGDASP